jgi:curved DNA-binding protein CbpA
MSDYFRVLGEPRRPWLDPEEVKKRFLVLSSSTHPDRLHNAPPEAKEAAQVASTELNRAHQVLTVPRERLRHLIELERGTKPADVQEISPELSDLFMQVHGDLRETQEFLRQRAAVTSPLLKVQEFANAQVWLQRLQKRQNSLIEMEQKLTEMLKALDSRWPSGGTPSETMVAEAESLYRRLSYVTKWLAQIQELMVRLTL